MASGDLVRHACHVAEIVRHVHQRFPERVALGPRCHGHVHVALPDPLGQHRRLTEVAHHVAHGAEQLAELVVGAHVDRHAHVAHRECIGDAHCFLHGRGDRHRGEARQPDQHRHARDRQQRRGDPSRHLEDAQIVEGALDLRDVPGAVGRQGIPERVVAHHHFAKRGEGLRAPLTRHRLFRCAARQRVVRQVRRSQFVELALLHHGIACGGPECGHPHVAKRIGHREPVRIVCGGGVLERALGGREQFGELAAELDRRIVPVLDARLLPLQSDAEQEVRGEDQGERHRGDGRCEAELLSKVELVDGSDDPFDHLCTLTTFTPVRSALADTYAMPPSDVRTCARASGSVCSSGGKLRPE